MTARTTVLATGYEETLQRTAELVAQHGGRSFEVAYDVVDRRLKPNEEPGPDDTVRWTVTAVFATALGDVTRAGSYDVAPGRAQTGGVQMACVRLLEACGVNTVVIDMPSSSTDPKE